MDPNLQKHTTSKWHLLTLAELQLSSYKSTLSPDQLDPGLRKGEALAFHDLLSLSGMEAKETAALGKVRVYLQPPL